MDLSAEYDGNLRDVIEVWRPDLLSQFDQWLIETAKQPVKTLSEMTDIHKKALAIIEGIESAEDRIKSIEESLKGFPGLAPSEAIRLRQEKKALSTKIKELRVEPFLRLPARRDRWPPTADSGLPT